MLLLFHSQLPPLSKGCLSQAEGLSNQLSKPMCSMWSSCQRNGKGRSWGSRRVNRGNDKESFKFILWEYLPEGRGSWPVLQTQPCSLRQAPGSSQHPCLEGARAPASPEQWHSGLLLAELVCSRPLFYTSSIWAKAKAMVGTKMPVKLF